MPTTHKWKPSASGFIYDPALYADGTAFAPGDTLVFNDGKPGAQSGVPGFGNLTTGTYQFSISGASASLQLTDLQLDGASTINVTGPGALTWNNYDQFANNGTIQVGSASASGTLNYYLYGTTSGSAAFANNGSVAVQNNSFMLIYPGATGSNGGTVLNAAGGVMSVNSGSSLRISGAGGYTDGSTLNGTVRNDGLINVGDGGPAGSSASLYMGTTYNGAGLVSVRGAPGSTRPPDTRAIIGGPASGTFDIASGKVEFDGKTSTAAVNFLDNAGELEIAPPYALSKGTTLFTGTVSGFQAGDTIWLNGFDSIGSNAVTFDPASHILTVSNTDGTPAVQLHLAGAYQTSDFKLTPVFLGTVFGEIGTPNESTTLTTTSTANAINPFEFQDSKTGAAYNTAGQQYSGPVNYLQSQFIWGNPDGITLLTHMPNVFMQGGAGADAIAASAGSNVLDGGLGSNFLIGAKGTDGGRDTFFLDGSAGTTWDTVVSFHPGDNVTLWGFVPGQSTLAWADNEGAAGYTGATLHSAFAGAGTAVNGSVTFAGLSLADSQSKLSVTPGSVGGRSYLLVHYNG